MPSIQAIALTLMALGGLFAALNWLYLYLTWYTGRFHSSIPLIGGVLLCVGMLLIPATRPYAWAAVLLDFGTITFVFGLPYLVGEFWSTNRFNLLQEYTGRLGIKTVHLRLFRKHIFTLKQNFQRECGLASVGTIGEWKQEMSHLLLRMGAESAVFELSSDGDSELLRQMRGFPSYEGTELSLAGMELSRPCSG